MLSLPTSVTRSVMQRIVSEFVLIALLMAACNSGGTTTTSNNPTQPPPNSVTIRFLYGSEKKDWVEAATQAFNLSHVQTTTNKKTIVVETKAEGSGQSMDDILQGAEKPALWGPASAVWLPLINDEWTKKQGSDLVNPDECQSVVASPIVIMMWEPYARALGWPEKEIG